MTARSYHGQRRLLAVIGAALVIAATCVFGLVLTSQHHTPRPPAAAAVPIAVTPDPTTSAGSPNAAGTSMAPRPATTVRGPILSKSTPLHLSIPTIGVSSDMLQLGLNPDHTVQVPPLGRDSEAGWYQYSPAPGQLGPSIILGHVDSAAYGPGVFFKLGALSRGAAVSITRADHRVAVFRVERVVEYPKDHFPTIEVYGNTDHAALRLITCGGTFDLSAHSYEDNIVAYASLVSIHST